MKYLVAIIPIFIMMTLAPALMAGNGSVFAQSSSQQIIEQAQSNAQAALCASGANTTFSCNNTSSQSQIIPETMLQLSKVEMEKVAVILQNKESDNHNPPTKTHNV